MGGHLALTIAPTGVGEAFGFEYCCCWRQQARNSISILLLLEASCGRFMLSIAAAGGVRRTIRFEY